MAPRNPGLVQSDAPLLLADLITALRLTGPGVGLLGFNDQITPTFIVGARGVVFEAQEPVFAPAEVFSDADIAVVAGTDIVDTGQLLAGDFDVICNISMFNAAAGGQFFTLKQMNAANTASVAEWAIRTPQPSNAMHATTTPLKFSMRVLEDERFVVDAALTDVTLSFAIWLMVRRRPDVS